MITEIGKTDLFHKVRWQEADDKGREISHGSLIIRDTVFRGEWVPSALFAGLATEPEHRGCGCMRRCYEKLQDYAMESGCLVGILHPFSFAAYNHFGFERVSETIVCDFPMAALDFVSRNSRMMPMEQADFADVLAIYNRFALKHNLFWKRDGIGDFIQGKEKRKIYVDYDETGAPAGYLVCEEEFHYDGINKNIFDNLHVWELVFDDRASLLRLLGFLRCYEGQYNTVRIHDIGMSPEIDWSLRRYMLTNYQIYPDLAVRILDLGGLLNLMKWPQEKGNFTLQVNDYLPNVGGTWQVEYANGKADVRKISASKSDLTVNAMALARLLYGTESFTAEKLPFVPGVEACGKVDDICRVFTKCNNGLYPHF